jgi:hypothetical protein
VSFWLTPLTSWWLSPLEIILIVSITTAIFILLELVHALIRRIAGRRWWYRNVYLWTPHWRLTRRWLLLLYGHKCHVCGALHYLDVDHKTYAHMWWEWLFFWDMQVLCRQHHVQKHGR